MAITYNTIFYDFSPFDVHSFYDFRAGVYAKIEFMKMIITHAAFS